jgi:hypothetical protein
VREVGSGDSKDASSRSDRWQKFGARIEAMARVEVDVEVRKEHRGWVARTTLGGARLTVCAKSKAGAVAGVKRAAARVLGRFLSEPEPEAVPA